MQTIYPAQMGKTFAGGAFNDRAEYAVIQVAVVEVFARLRSREVVAVRREEVIKLAMRRQGINQPVAQRGRVVG